MEFWHGTWWYALLPFFLRNKNSILKLISAASNQDVSQTSASFGGEDNAHIC